MQDKQALLTYLRQRLRAHYFHIYGLLNTERNKDTIQKCLPFIIARGISNFLLKYVRHGSLFLHAHDAKLDQLHQYVLHELTGMSCDTIYI
jgi:hypothetical protein